MTVEAVMLLLRTGYPGQFVDIQFEQLVDVVVRGLCIGFAIICHFSISFILSSQWISRLSTRHPRGCPPSQWEISTGSLCECVAPSTPVNWGSLAAGDSLLCLVGDRSLIDDRGGRDASSCAHRLPRTALRRPVRAVRPRYRPWSVLLFCHLLPFSNLLHAALSVGHQRNACLDQSKHERRREQKAGRVPEAATNESPSQKVACGTSRCNKSFHC